MIFSWLLPGLTVMAYFIYILYNKFMPEFKLVSKYQPTGDQPGAIKKLTDGILRGVHEQTLLGVTGSGKTFTMANIIQNVQRPTLILQATPTAQLQKNKRPNQKMGQRTK